MKGYKIHDKSAICVPRQHLPIHVQTEKGYSVELKIAA
jgi:hypothetical protein